MPRTNAGYEIIESHRFQTGDELVIGYRANAPAPYVCWWCSNGDNYYWGDYCPTLDAARQSMMRRMCS